MKILKIFEEKLRYKNYSERSINLYISCLSKFLIEEKIKDPYQVTTSKITKYLETNSYSSISQQNQYIGCLKLFDHNHVISQLSKIDNIKHKAILTLIGNIPKEIKKE